MSGKAPDVASLALAVLNGVIAHYAAATLEPGGELPEYRALRQGEPRTFAWDFPALLVCVPTIRWGVPSAAGLAQPVGPAAGMMLRHAVITVTLIRTAVDPDGPVDQAAMHAAGLVQIRDQTLVRQAIDELCGSGGPFPRGSQAMPGDVVVLGPEGGIVAVEGSLNIVVLDTVGP